MRQDAAIAAGVGVADGATAGIDVERVTSLQQAAVVAQIGTADGELALRGDAAALVLQCAAGDLQVAPGDDLALAVVHTLALAVDADIIGIERAGTVVDADRGQAQRLVGIDLPPVAQLAAGADVDRISTGIDRASVVQSRGLDVDGGIGAQAAAVADGLRGLDTQTIDGIDAAAGRVVQASCLDRNGLAGFDTPAVGASCAAGDPDRPLAGAHGAAVIHCCGVDRHIPRRLQCAAIADAVVGLQ